MAARSPAHLPPGTLTGASPRALPRCKWATDVAKLHISTHRVTLPGYLLGAAHAGLHHGTGRQAQGFEIRLGCLHHT